MVEVCQPWWWSCWVGDRCKWTMTSYVLIYCVYNMYWTCVGNFIQRGQVTVSGEGTQQARIFVALWGHNIIWQGGGSYKEVIDPREGKWQVGSEVRVAHLQDWTRNVTVHGSRSKNRQASCWERYVLYNVLFTHTHIMK